MILVIIKCLFDLEITYENKNASIEIQQSLLSDNFIMQASWSIVRYVYNHIEIQSKTLLNLSLFLWAYRLYRLIGIIGFYSAEPYGSSISLFSI